MPLYEYQCPSCGLKFEAIVPVEKRNNIACDCGSKAKKLISRPVPITETSFPFTGIKDKRLGNIPIQNRKDFESRLEQKGLAMADKADIDDMFCDHDTSGDIIKSLEAELPAELRAQANTE